VHAIPAVEYLPATHATHAPTAVCVVADVDMPALHAVHDVVALPAE